MFLQPTSLIRVLLRDRLSLLLVGSLAVVKAMNESESVSDGQQTDLVAEVTPESLFEHTLRTVELRKGCSERFKSV